MRARLEFVRLRRALAALVVTVCIGAPIVEAFDQWDDTLRDGNDTEANLVIAVLCVGMAVSFIRLAVTSIRDVSAHRESPATGSPRALVIPLNARFQPIPNSSPPAPLRI